MSTNRTILKNFSALTAAQIVSTLAGVASTVWLARYLGPEGFGLLGFGVALLTYFAMLANMGTDALTAREIARDPANAVNAANKTLGLRVVLALAAYLMFVLAVFVTRDDTLGREVLLVQGGVLFATAITLDFFLQGLERMGVNALRQSAQALIILIGAVVFVSGPEDIVAAAALTPVAGAITALVVFVWARGAYSGLGLTFRPKDWPSRIRASSAFALMTLMNTILLSFDVVMIGLWLDDAAVGIYSAALKLALMVMLPAAMLSSAWFPVLSRTFGDKTEMQKQGDLFARYIFCLGVPVAVIGGVFAPAAVRGLFGAAYAEAAPIAVILMVVAGIMHLHTALGAALPAWSREQALAYICVVGAVVNVAGNAFLIPMYGGVGAAVASVVSYFVMACVSAVVYRQTAEALPMRALVAAAAASLPTLPIALGVLMAIGGRMPPLLEAGLGGLIALTGYLIVARVTRLLPSAAWDFVFNRRRGEA